MDITPQISAGRQLILGYGGGAFIIAQKRYEHSVVVQSEQTTEWDAALTEEALFALAEKVQGAEILLIGTGKQPQFISPALGAQIKQRYGMVVEAMDTGAACRTFNVLLAEDRLVAAALKVI